MNKKALLVLLLLLASVLSSCTGRGAPCAEELIYKILPYGEELTADDGYIYILDEELDEALPEKLNEERMVLMYGKDMKEYISKIEDCAIFVSKRSPSEIALFKCYSASDAKKIEKVCRERADTLKVVLRNTEWQSKSQNIMIEVIKEGYVLFAFTENNASLKKELLRLI